MTYTHLLIFIKFHNLNFFSLFLPHICSMFPAMILQAATRTPILCIRWLLLLLFFNNIYVFSCGMWDLVL